MLQKLDGTKYPGDALGPDSRWSILRNFLLGKDGAQGFLDKKSAQANFSLTMYDAKWINRELQAGATPVTCPRVVPNDSSIMPKDGNVATIRNTLAATTPDVDGDTPTGPAIQKILQSFGTGATTGDPTIFILATDGEPDSCEFVTGLPMPLCTVRPSHAACQTNPPYSGTVKEYVREESVRAVKAVLARNIRTYVIGVGSLENETQTHFKTLAQAGVPAGETPIYRDGADSTVLEKAITEIVNAQISCQVKLRGRVTGDPCSGTVNINGEDTALTCNPSNNDGWVLRNESMLEILGPACRRLKESENPRVQTRFPCGVAEAS